MRAMICAISCACFAASSAGAQVLDPRSNCQVQVDPVDFGDYSVIASAPTDSTGRIELKCSGNIAGSDVRVTLSPGFAGHYHDRTLIHGADRLNYNLYVGPGRSIVAGDGSQGTLPLIPAPGGVGFKAFKQGRASEHIVYNIYGRIFSRQAVPAGAYLDEIAVIVEF